MRTRERKRGHPTTKENIRFPLEQTDFARQMGPDLTKGLVRTVDFLIDALAELGPLRRELELRAYEEQITEGQALGRWAKEGIERARKGQRARRPT